MMIPLYRKCPRCEGARTEPRGSFYREPRPCSECRGVGFLATGLTLGRDEARRPDDRKEGRP